MDRRTQYPDMIGYQLVKDLQSDDNAPTLERCINITLSISDLRQRQVICDASTDLHFVVLIAELALQIRDAQACTYPQALESLLDLDMRPVQMKIVLRVLEPAVKGKYQRKRDISESIGLSLTDKMLERLTFMLAMTDCLHQPHEREVFRDFCSTVSRLHLTKVN